jgi:hypothetical protein
MLVELSGAIAMCIDFRLTVGIGAAVILSWGVVRKRPAMLRNTVAIVPIRCLTSGETL